MKFTSTYNYYTGQALHGSQYDWLAALTKLPNTSEHMDPNWSVLIKATVTSMTRTFEITTTIKYHLFAMVSGLLGFSNLVVSALSVRWDQAYI